MAEKYISKRVSFLKGKQQEILKKILKKFSIEETARLCNVSERTIRDWLREKYLMRYDFLLILCKFAKLKIPKDIKLKDQYWYAEKGAVLGYEAVIKKYGEFPKNEKYRKIKWYEWWDKEGKFRKDLIINKTKTFKRPNFSSNLAEFVGIMIGDGGMTKSQIRITLNKEGDKEYCDFVYSLINKIFDIFPSKCYRKNQKALDLIISRSKMVNFCNKELGLKIGNKIKQKVDIPEWIKKNFKFQKACLRGLVDTDGCIFNEVHRVNNKKYSYKRLNFTNKSSYLIKFVFNILKILNLDPKVRRAGVSVQIENNKKINHYFKIIGTNNLKHLNRFRRS